MDPTLFQTVTLSIIVFAIGASVGSFVNVVADRLPAGQSLVSPRSRCSTCNRPLPNNELLPVISYIWLRGRCRNCDAEIPLRLVAIEVVTGLLFTAAYIKFGFGAEFVLTSASVALLLAVAVIDLEHGLILNRVVFPSAVVLLLLAPFWTELGLPRTFLDSSAIWASLANSLVAAVGGFALFLAVALIYPGGMGGGDVKLAGLLGLLIGFPGVVAALWGAVVTGGLVAIALLVVRRKGRKDSIPFGPFMSLGGIVVLLAGAEILAGYQRLVDTLTGV